MGVFEALQESIVVCGIDESERSFLAYVIHLGCLWSWDQNSHRMISLSDIKDISSFPRDFYSEITSCVDVLCYKAF